jgi:hypothetical protein
MNNIAFHMNCIKSNVKSLTYLQPLCESQDNKKLKYFRFSCFLSFLVNFSSLFFLFYLLFCFLFYSYLNKKIKKFCPPPLIVQFLISHYILKGIWNERWNVSTDVLYRGNYQWRDYCADIEHYTPL